MPVTEPFEFVGGDKHAEVPHVYFSRRQHSLSLKQHLLTMVMLPLPLVMVTGLIGFRGPGWSDVRAPRADAGWICLRHLAGAEPDPCGAGVHIDFLSKELAKLAQVEVRCFGDQSSNESGMHIQGVQPSLSFLAAAANPQLKMFQNLSRNVELSQSTMEADVVHCHTWYTHLAGIFTRELLQIPLFLTTHSLETHRPWKVEQLGNGYFLSRWIAQQAYRTADGIIAVSEQMRTDVVEAYGVDPSKVTVIHNGIDPDFYGADVQPDDDLRFVHVVLHGLFLVALVRWLGGASWPDAARASRVGTTLRQ